MTNYIVHYSYEAASPFKTGIFLKEVERSCENIVQSWLLQALLLVWPASVRHVSLVAQENAPEDAMRNALEIAWEDARIAVKVARGDNSKIMRGGNYNEL